MRHGAYWGDVQVRNISSRGLLLHVENPPPSGSYLEIRRGPHVVVGRAVWQEGNFVGIRTQDPIDIDAIVALSPAREGSRDDRRTQPRAAPAPITAAIRAERSRIWSTTFQFALLAACGLAAAALAASTVYDLLNRPFAAIEEALDAGR